MIRVRPIHLYSTEDFDHYLLLFEMLSHLSLLHITLKVMHGYFCYRSKMSDVINFDLGKTVNFCVENLIEHSRWVT